MENNASNNTLYGKKKVQYKDFRDGEAVLLRKEGSSLNRVCIIVRKTEKAVLIKVDRDFEDDLAHDWMFWIPKSVIFMLEGEARIYYLKHWAKIRNIGK